MWTQHTQTPFSFIPRYHPKLFHIYTYKDFIYEHVSSTLAASNRFPRGLRRSTFLQAECKAKGAGGHYMHVSSLPWRAAGSVTRAQIWSQPTGAGQCVWALDPDRLLALVQNLFFLRSLTKKTPSRCWFLSDYYQSNVIHNHLRTK